jgi:hypothetical protein
MFGVSRGGSARRVKALGLFLLTVLTFGFFNSGSAVTLSPPVIQANVISFSFDSVAGQVFIVQSAAALGADWTDVTSFPGTGNAINFSGPVSGDQRFYRVKVMVVGSLDLSPSTPVLATGPVSLPDAAVGVAYAEQISPASSGVPPYTMQISGTPPDGVTLSISNNATAGAFVQVASTGAGLVADQRRQFSVTVTDSVNGTVSRNYDLRVVAPPPQISAGLLTFKAGENANVNLTATGGAGALSWSLVSGPLPDGLNLSASGTLTGMPSADAAEKNETGRYTNVIEVADSLTDRVTGALTPRRVTAPVEMLVRLSYVLNLRATRVGGPSFLATCTFCHGLGFEPDFTAPTAAAVIDVGSGSGGLCGTSRVYITPGDTANSLIYLKTSVTPPCGARMPQGGPFLSEQRWKRLERWILELTPADTD